MNFLKITKIYKLHTFPHEDFAVSSGAIFPLSSSAKPQVQSLQAFRLPVVLHTKIAKHYENKIILAKYLNNLQKIYCK